MKESLSGWSHFKMRVRVRVEMDSAEERRETHDDPFSFFDAPAPDVSSLLKDFLSNSDINYFDKENNAHYSTFCLLNKASIVHSIQQRTANRAVPEGILDSLEIIERLDRQQGLPISDTMREAFCAVAVHCTFTSLLVSWSCFFDAVQRIWRFRIRNLEDAGTSNLVGPNLRIWRDELEAALWDAETSKRLLKRNTQVEALVRISDYIEEVHSSMKPAFLALASLSSQARPRSNGTDKERKKVLGVNPQRRCKLRSSHRRFKRPVNTAASEEDRPSCSNYGVLSTPEVNEMQDATDHHPQGLEVDERFALDKGRKIWHTEDIVKDSNKDKNVPATSINPTIDVPATSLEVNEMQDRLNPNTLLAGVTYPHPQGLEVDERFAFVKARKNFHTEDIVEDRSKDKDVPATSVNPTIDVPATSPEVNEMQDVLNHSTLLAGVTYPHPEGLEVDERFTFIKTRKNLRTEDIVEARNKDKDVPATSVNPTIDVPATSSEVNEMQDALNRSTLSAGVTYPLPQGLEVDERFAFVKARKNLHAEDIVEDRNKDKDVPATSVNPTTDVPAPSVNPTTDVPVTSINPTTDVPVTSVNHIIGPAQAKRVAVAGKILHSARHPCTGKRKGILRVNSRTRRQLGSSHRRHGRVTIVDSEGKPSCSNYGSLSTPEVRKLQDALKSSVADLQAAVTDPLPEALEVAERVASYIAGKKLRTKSIVEGNKDKDVPATSVKPMDSTPAKRIAPDISGKNLHAKPVEEDDRKMDKSVPPSSFNPGREHAQAKDGNQGNQALHHHNSVPRPSLMERNGTAHTYEWEDSIDVSTKGTTSCSNRRRLPSPKVKHVSPLKEHVTEKWSRKRKAIRWSLPEEEALMKGVKEYGRRWKRILKSNPEAFNPVRIPGDLKDKWRNMRGR